MTSDTTPAVLRSTWVRRGRHRLHVRYRTGLGVPIVLLHGFPDSLHLYDRLLPHLNPDRAVVTFDFLGWGDSDKPAGYPYTATNQVGDIDAVIRQLGLERVVLVAHDASGPPAIDWALAHPDQVAGLVLLNTYYAAMLRVRPPEAIALYSTPILRVLARAVARRFAGFDRWLYTWQVGRFITDPQVRRTLVPEFYERFRPARPAFWRLNEDLIPTLIDRRRRVGRLRGFTAPVRIVFGADDPYLNVHVARDLAGRFPTADLHLIAGARHYVQVDEPRRVATLIESLA
jgi:pimeloyl-ACP methyl ester carboxylesterase